MSHPSLVLRARVLALGFLAFAAAVPFLAAETPISLSVDLQKPGVTIAPDFNGLSYEITTLLPVNGVRYFRPDNTALLTLFRTLGLKHLRVGGNTSDRNAQQLPAEADWDSLFAFAKAADVKVIYCLRLHDGDPAAATATVKYIMDRYAPLVDSVSIGQEPSAYPAEKVDSRPPGERMGAAVEKYPYASYRDHWREFAATISTAVPNVKFCGPSVHNNGDWARKFIADFGRDHHVGLITEHLYAGGAAGKLPSAEVGRDRMLSGEFYKVYEKLHASFVPAARAAGLPYRLEEVNSYFNGGALDASDTAAAALWGLEFMHWWAAHDAAGPYSRIAGTGRPRIARACSANSLRSCEARVTRPVSCGRGETSLNQTSSPFTNSSTPNTPQPPRSSVMLRAMPCARASARVDIGRGCQLSR